MIIPKPMKAPTEPINLDTDLKSGVKYYVQPKLDGIRIKFHNGVPYTNTGKEIPNKRVRTELQAYYKFIQCKLNLDGELMIIDDNLQHLPFNDIQSIVMSHSSDSGYESNWQFIVFDYDDGAKHAPYYKRLWDLVYYFNETQTDSLKLTLIPYGTFEPIPAEEVGMFKEACNHIISQGFEGAMIKRWDSHYHYGKLPATTDVVRKYVDWVRDEATIVACIEAQKNLDTSSKCKDAMIPAGYLGAFLVRHPKFGQFQIGSGFNSLQRDMYWRQQKEMIGQLVTFKYRPDHMKDAPCPAIFVGLRAKEDIST